MVPEQELDIEDIPSSFWIIIDAAAGDSTKLGNLISGMPKKEMFAFWQYYKSAQFNLTTEEHLLMLEWATEDDIDDITEWVVAQGLAHYLNVYNNPLLLPRTLPSNPEKSPLSVIITVYLDTFNEWYMVYTSDE